MGGGFHTSVPPPNHNVMTTLEEAVIFLLGRVANSSISITDYNEAKRLLGAIRDKPALHPRLQAYAESFSEGLSSDVEPKMKDGHVDCPCWETGAFSWVENCIVHPHKL
jgi:hypothetical protein